LKYSTHFSLRNFKYFSVMGCELAGICRSQTGGSEFKPFARLALLRQYLKPAPAAPEIVHSASITQNDGYATGTEPMDEDMALAMALSESMQTQQRACHDKIERSVVNAYHDWTHCHSTALTEAVQTFPTDIVRSIEMFLCPIFELRVPLFPYPAHLFEKIRREYFYYQIRIGFLGARHAGVSSIILQSLRNSVVDSSLPQLSGYDRNDVFFAHKTSVTHGDSQYDCQLSIYKDRAMIFGERHDPSTLHDPSAAHHHPVVWNPMANDSQHIDIDVYVLVFDVLSEESFESVTRNVADIKAVKRNASDRDLCVVLVGAQCDRVSKKDGVVFDVYSALKAKTSAFCEQYACPYVECSAQQNANIEELFDVAVKEAIMYKGERTYSRS